MGQQGRRARFDHHLFYSILSSSRNHDVSATASIFSWRRPESSQSTRGIYIDVFYALASLFFLFFFVIDAPAAGARRIEAGDAERVEGFPQVVPQLRGLQAQEGQVQIRRPSGFLCPPPLSLSFFHPSSIPSLSFFIFVEREVTADHSPCFFQNAAGLPPRPGRRRQEGPGTLSLRRSSANPFPFRARSFDVALLLPSTPTGVPAHAIRNPGQGHLVRTGLALLSHPPS